jgi:hypothetical protein
MDRGEAVDVVSAPGSPKANLFSVITAASSNANRRRSFSSP